MAKGFSLHIGLDAVDPHHYAQWPGRLLGAEADANDMAALAREQGFSPLSLLTTQATRQAVVDQLLKAAETLEEGDFFLLTYSGHGGQLPDWNGDEIDRLDETWCLYDQQLVDDELYGILGLFRRGVRILVLADSCHSGTTVKMAFYRPHLDINGERLYRAMPPAVAQRVYRDNRALYDPILNRRNDSKPAPPQASVLLLSACQDNQLAADGPFNGLFTATLLQVWQGGAFEGDYRRFHRRIVQLMPPDQTPNYLFLGTPDPRFEQQRPFTL